MYTLLINDDEHLFTVVVDDVYVKCYLKAIDGHQQQQFIDLKKPPDDHCNH